MNDRDLERRLQAWYRGDDGAPDSAPAELRASVASIPDTAPAPGRGLRARRNLTLLAAAAVLIAGGAVAAGAGLLRDEPLLPRPPSDAAVTVPDASSGPATSAPSPEPTPALTPVPTPVRTPAPTPASTPSDELAPGFAWTGSPGIAESGPLGGTATLLGDGTVLITEGCGTQAERYDPATGTFLPTGAMTVMRGSSTATLLLDGRVLFTGGYNCGRAGRDGLWATAELYDPSSGTFSPTGAMAEPREFHTATLLPDGRVLIAGGITGPAAPVAGGVVLASVRTVDTDQSLTRAELYDPATGTFTWTGALHTARNNHTATLLDGGRVLVTGGGGEGTASSRSAEVYEPATETWRVTGSMETGRWLHTATLLRDGRVLVLGGRSPRDSVYASAELYDPQSGEFGAAGRMDVGRQQHTATLLDDGRVLIAGGYWSDGQRSRTLPSAEVYDPGSGAFAVIGPIGTSRQEHTATRLVDGRVLIVGGITIGDNGGVPVTSAVLYQP